MIPPTSDSRRPNSESPFFDFLRQAHAISVSWANGLIDRSDKLDLHTRNKAKFYFRQLSSAFSPSNFFATNPEVLKERPF
jgi:polyhydroxyalkanoate synthase